MPEYDPNVREQILRKLRHERNARLLAYALIVLISAYFFYQQGQTSKNLCHGATENRVALRGLVKGVGKLGEDLIRNDDNSTDKLTHRQEAAMVRVENFQKAQLKTLELPICE